MDRREFLCSVGAAAAVAGSSHVASASTAPTVTLKQRPLKIGDVKLTQGLISERFALNAKRTFAIPSDDILMPFYRAKGLPSRGKELNGDFAAKTQTGAWPGLYSTFWMSGAAQMARWSGDPSQAKLLAHMVHELAETREPDGFLLAMGRSPGERWNHSDLFALVRSMVRCNLDIYELTGDPLALELARGQMDCLYNDLEDHQPAGGGVFLKGMQRPLNSSYKLMPAISQLFLHTGDERYLKLADMCVDTEMMHGLLEGSKTDPIADHHASTWADYFMGLYQIGLATGNQRYVDTALAAWTDVVQKHLFITGSMSSGEYWRSGVDGWQLRETERAQETCCAGIWVAFEQNLLHGTGDMAHADQIEDAAFNDLFATQSPMTGDFCYFLDLQGKNKPYDPPPARAYHCCDGNGLMGIGRLGGVIYGKTDDGLAINLYAGSEAVSDGIKIRQETDYPANGTVVVRVDPDQPRSFTLHYRIPKWGTSPAQVTVNGERVEANGMIAREWKAGDQVRLEFPIQPTIVHDTRIGIVRMAMRRGPVVYAGTWSDDLPVRMSGKIHEQGALSTVDTWPYVPTVIASSTSAGKFEAEALSPAVPDVPQSNTGRTQVHFKPFYEVTEGKYSVWFPEVQL